MKEIKIGTKYVGKGHPVYIIAEIGSNHDGSFEKSQKMIDIALKCGVDAVKFQFFKADTIAANTSDKIAILENGKSIHQFYNEVETPYEWIPLLNDYCNKKGITFLATPFDIESAQILYESGVQAFKIASFEIVDYPLIEFIASKKVPIILSTGMASLGDIEEALKIIKKYHSEYILLHCGINYPLSFTDVNLKAIKTLKRAFDCPVGYSDHTEGLVVPILGVGFGMDIIEKHFTLSKDEKGPDHPFAIEPESLKLMVNSIRNAEAALGSSAKAKVDSETIHYKRGRRSLFASRDLDEGTEITMEDLAILRPGIGLHPGNINIILGKKVKKFVKKETPITWDLFLS